MSEVRVLQVVPSFVMGGAERLSAQLAIELSGAGFDVRVISLYDPQGTELERMLASERIPVSFLGKRRGFDPRMFGRVYRVIKQFHPDVVHTHLHALNYAVPPALVLRARIVHTVHSVAEREAQRIGRHIPGILFRRAVAPVAIGREIQTSIKRVFGTDSHLIPNGIPLARYAQPSVSRERWRSQMGFASDAMLFVSVGRFDPVKNHAQLIDAFALATGNRPNTHLLLVGNGDLQNLLKAQTKTLALTGRVHFLGVREDIPEVLGASDVFVFASKSEASPLSVMEALAAGLPIVGTAVGSVPEMVVDDWNGTLVRAGDSSALAAAMTGIQRDSTLRSRMGFAARASALDFDIRKMAQSYATLYMKVAGSRGSVSFGSAPC
jgi:glycosyltransferase involved in cell wall biosynthesis